MYTAASIHTCTYVHVYQQRRLFTWGCESTAMMEKHDSHSRTMNERLRFSRSLDCIFFPPKSHRLESSRLDTFNSKYIKFHILPWGVVQTIIQVQRDICQRSTKWAITKIFHAKDQRRRDATRRRLFRAQFQALDAATYTNNRAGFSKVLLVTLRGLWRIRATILARVMLRRKLSLHEYPSMQIPLWH